MTDSVKILSHITVIASEWVSKNEIKEMNNLKNDKRTNKISNIKRKIK